MAERRMFSKTIVDSDAFLEMPLSTQALYFHLSMRADDDGFLNNARKIQRIIGASDDDLKLLVAKKFIIPFETGVIVIKHWKIHNYIRGDRKKNTVYSEELSMLEEKDNGAYELRNDLAEIPEENCETKRQKAYKESSLPYSFEYKIKEAFTGEACPVCGFKMQMIAEDGIISKNRIPTIQHNIPISKGGKHELGNISVICKECNISIRDNETGELNSREVMEKWDKICMAGKLQTSDCHLSVGCRSSDCIGKVSIGKVSIVEGSISSCPEPEPAPDRIPAIALTLNDKTEYWIYEDQVNEWTELFPAVDVMQELRKMKSWLDSNTSRRKTKRGILRFVNGWLSKEQDKGRTQRRTDVDRVSEVDGW